MKKQFVFFFLYKKERIKILKKHTYTGKVPLLIAVIANIHPVKYNSASVLHIWYVL